MHVKKHTSYLTPAKIVEYLPVGRSTRQQVPSLLRRWFVLRKTVVTSGLHNLEAYIVAILVILYICVVYLWIDNLFRITWTGGVAVFNFLLPAYLYLVTLATEHTDRSSGQISLIIDIHCRVYKLKLISISISFKLRMSWISTN